MIFYTIDGSLPRFDNTELEILDYLFRQFKMVYPTSLKWWNQIVIILSKCNTITLLKYGSSGGLPKYEYKEWLRTSNRKKILLVRKSIINIILKRNLNLLSKNGSNLLKKGET